jgi:hypothetical protein
VNSFVVYSLKGTYGELYKTTSLYLKYDLNPLNNTIKQNNASLGVRFDFNRLERF